MKGTLLALATAAGVWAADRMLLARRGDADIAIDFSRLGDRVLYQESPEHVMLEFTVPFVHGPRARQQALIIDVMARVVPDGDRYRGGSIAVTVNNTELPRDDGYFEAIAVKLKKSLSMQVRLDVRMPAGGNAVAWLQGIGSLRLEVGYKFYCRTPIRYGRQEVVLALTEWTSLAPHPMPAPLPPPPPKVSPPPDARVLPIRTHLLRPEDDVVAIVRRYVQPLAQPGDVVAIAESALAIMQGRVKNVEDIQPRFMARRLNRFFMQDSSLSSVYACEMAIREIGEWRFVLATVAGAVGKLMGRSGDFYRVAGPDVAAIDDCTGTLPPYDKCVVMGPKDSDRVCRDIKTQTGLEAAIVDANDLRKCQVLGISTPDLSQMVHDSLLDNPQGNGDEQTPIVLIRRNPAVVTSR